eukprot:TRINITY_DN10909_c0_g1_i1.p1 TRINITY_DN10909_c0_g1~~TRINITY_DN10909_c0_g1_i1.p1  ORF type:complete len:1784 (+),score=486.25 TRINITY_DN10909_c0_g1_i1:130-5352(+)
MQEVDGDPVPAALMKSHGSCGKVLKEGDPVVTCETCGEDSTCIVCMDCWDPSKHVGHDYRISASGGGTCDCGDATAWDPAGFCDHHQGVTAETDPLEGISNDDVERCGAVIRAVIHLAALDAARVYRSFMLPHPTVDPSWASEAEAQLAGIGEPGTIATTLVKDVLDPVATISNATCRVVALALMDGVGSPGYRASPHAMLYGAGIGEFRVGVPFAVKDSTKRFRLGFDRLCHRLFSDFYFRTHFAMHFIRDIPRTLPPRPHADWVAVSTVQFLTVPSVIAALGEPDPARCHPGIYHAITKAMHDHVITSTDAIRTYDAAAPESNMGSEDEAAAFDANIVDVAAMVESLAGDLPADAAAGLEALLQQIAQQRMGGGLAGERDVLDVVMAEDGDDEEHEEDMEEDFETMDSDMSMEQVPLPVEDAAFVAAAVDAGAPSDAERASLITSEGDADGGAATDTDAAPLIVEGLSSRSKLRISMRNEWASAQRQLAMLLNQCLRVSLKQVGERWVVLGDPLLRDRVLIHLLVAQQNHLIRRLDLDTNTIIAARYELMVLSPTFTLLLPDAALDAPDGAILDITTAALRFMAAYTSTIFPGGLSAGADPVLPWLYDNNPYGNLAHGVTFQLPLHRFLAQMAHRLIITGRVDRMADLMDVEEFIAAQAAYVEPVVNLFAIRGQCRAMMWRRNHMHIAEQADDHTRYAQHSDGAYQDIFLLQLYAAAAGPSALAVHLARRFAAPQPLLPEEGAEYEYDVLPEFLTAALQIATDRTKLTASETTLLRDRVLTYLATGARKYSSISRHVLQDVDDRPWAAGTGAAELQAVLAEVAEAVPGQKGTLYSLKPGAWGEVSPYTASWVSHHVSDAEVEYARVMFKGRHEKKGSLHLPCPRPRTPDAAVMRPVIGILHADVVVGTAVAAVHRALSVAEKGGEVAAEMVVLRMAVDVLLLAVRTHDEYAAAYPLVADQERAFNFKARDCVAAAFPHLGEAGQSSPGHAPPHPAVALATPAYGCSIGTTPLHLLLQLRRVAAFSDTHAAAEEIIAAAAAACPAAQELLQNEQTGVASTCDSLTNAPTVAAKRKAKGKARQQAAMNKMQKQQQAVNIDFDSDSDECGSPREPVDTDSDGLHAYMDYLHVDDNDACCICNMPTAPISKDTELAFVALCTRGNGLAECCRPVKNGRLEANASWGVADTHRTTMTFTHICSHLVHAECMLKHIASRGSSRHRPPQLQGTEFTCPMCRRMGNALIPLIAPTEGQQASGKMFRHNMVPLLTTAQDGAPRTPAVVEQQLRDIAAHPSPTPSGTPPTTAEARCEALHYPAVVTAGGLNIAEVWGQQVAAAELETRVTGERTVPMRKLVYLRAQLKALLASSMEDTTLGMKALAALLGWLPPAEGDSDAFTAWVRAVVGVALRHTAVGHAGLRFLTQRAVQAKFLALLRALDQQGALSDAVVGALPAEVQQAVAQVRAHVQGAPPQSGPLAVASGEPLDVAAYLRRELAVFCTWLAVGSAAVLARVGADATSADPGELALALAPSYDDPAAALNAAGTLLHGVAGVGDGYAALADVARAALQSGDASCVVLKAPGLWESHHPPRLIPLPHEFHEALRKYYRAVDAPCVACGEVPDTPAVCLACGEVFCSVLHRGCRAAGKHAGTGCGGGHSLFLLPHNAGLLASRGSHVYRLPSFYLDAHGEADPGLRRGRPLFLNAARVKHTLHMAALSSYGHDPNVAETLASGWGTFYDPQEFE